MSRSRNKKQNKNSQGFDQKVLQIRRVSKKTKGGDRISFTALVVLGDHKGRVGVGLGKAPGVKSAIQKASRKATHDLVNLPLQDGTIPHTITARFSAAEVLLKPAPQGTGIIAGGSVRAVVEVAGVQNIVAKMLGNNNKLTNVFATIKALRKIENLQKKHAYRRKQAGLEKSQPKTKKTKKSTSKPSKPAVKPTARNFDKLSTRTQNALKQAKITPDKLTSMTDKQILAISGIGKKGLQEINNHFSK